MKMPEKAPINFFIREIKWRFCYMLLSVVITFTSCYLVAPDLLFWITKPCQNFQTHFVFFNIPEALYTTLKVCALVSLCTVIPVFWYQLWSFLVPSFTMSERVRVTRVSILFFVLLSLSIYWTFSIGTPLLVEFLLQYQVHQGSFILKYQATLASYVSWVWSCLLLVSLLAQCPTILFIGLLWGKLKPENITKYRKLIFLLCICLAASLSPPDIVLQTVMTLGLWLYSEFIILCFFIYNALFFKNQ